MPITQTRYSDEFENLNGDIEATSRRIKELGERATHGTEEERANAGNAMIAGAMFRIRRGSHQIDRRTNLHRVALVEQRDDGNWSLCTCGFAALGEQPDDFTAEEFSTHPGHRDRSSRP